MNTKATLLAMVALGMGLGGAPLAAQDSTDGVHRTTLDGVYAAAQAEEGEGVYQRVCVECHAKDEYTGEMMAGWVGAPLYDLWEIITTKMPDDNPGSLSRTEYIGVLAYILQLNGMPAGAEELSTRSSALKNITFTWGK